MKKKTGKVYLIGAGPGNPKLITLKGMECIKEADVVVYDYLANPRLLAFAKPDAGMIYVGKSGRAHTMEQEDINRLLVNKAKEGNVVARLKGGDPLVFGRGGEEALALAENDILFEFVPGISSAYAVPAYAGIPVTHRGISSSVAFITGHEDPTKPDSDIDWEKLAGGVGTLVFLMGVKNLPLIAGKLMEHGRPSDTPVALIRWGTTPNQETITGTLKNITEKVKVANFKPPAITIVGDVVSLREKLKWFENKPLFGKKVIVTRSRNQSSELVEALENLGAEATEFPTIKIISPQSYDELDNAIKKILNSRLLSGRRPSEVVDPTPDSPLSYDWIIFTSVNGVSSFLDRLYYLGSDVRDLKGIKLAAIGPATAGKLKELGLKIDYIPSNYKAESVIEGFKDKGVKGAKILIPRAKVAREILPDKLREFGAQVDVVTAYQTIIDGSYADKIREMLEKEEIDIVTFTSSSTVKNFVEILKDVDLKKVLKNVTVAGIGPITSKTAEELGLKVDISAKEYTIKGLVEAIVFSCQPPAASCRVEE